MNWFQMNNAIFKMEEEEPYAKADPILYKDWVEKWNNLLDESKKLPGCLKREKRIYEENIRQEETEITTGEGEISKDERILHGDLEKEAT